MVAGSNSQFDVVIVGLGAVGSAASYHLSKRGMRVIGFDKLVPPHSFGSSHGDTRIIREAYYEHPLYVPFVQRAYELWGDLEDESGRDLFQPTGGLMVGPTEGEVVSGALNSAQTHGLEYERMSAAEVRQRFPAFRLTDDLEAVWEPRAGVLFPDGCIEAHLELSMKQGAEFRLDEAVIKWQPNGEGVDVVTAGGKYRGSKLILAAGAWNTRFLPELKLPLTVERQILFWFEPRDNREVLSAGRLPIFLFEYSDAGDLFYGFPDNGDGVKVAQYHGGELVDPDTIRREVNQEEVERMRQPLRRYLPDAEGALVKTAVCMYTNTPDYHFLIDFHPNHPQVLIASPCSGHGFKFSTAIGEVLADLLTKGRTGFDLSPFSLARFGA